MLPNEMVLAPLQKLKIKYELEWEPQYISSLAPLGQDDLLLKNKTYAFILDFCFVSLNDTLHTSCLTLYFI